jgi:hypothetical protein
MDWIRSPKGRIIPSPFILHPNYQEVRLVKTQIRWCEETTYYFLTEDFNFLLFSQYVDLANFLKEKLKKLAR